MMRRYLLARNSLWRRKTNNNPINSSSTALFCVQLLFLLVSVGISSVSSTSSSSATATAIETPLRINCGSEASFVDSQTLHEWTNDANTYCTMGSMVNTCASNKNGTKVNSLYCTARIGDVIQYDIPGFTVGKMYTITLYFTETYWKEPNRRLADIYVENRLIRSRYDYVSQCGYRQQTKSGCKVRITVTMNDTIFNLRIKQHGTTSKIDDIQTTMHAPTLNGLQILATKKPSKKEYIPVTNSSSPSIPTNATMEPFIVRINSGFLLRNWTDPKTNSTWIRDQHYITSYSKSEAKAQRFCDGIRTPGLFFCSFRVGKTIVYQIPVNKKIGTYQVTLFMTKRASDHQQDSGVTTTDNGNKVAIYVEGIIRSDYNTSIVKQYDNTSDGSDRSRISIPTVYVNDGNIDLKVQCTATDSNGLQQNEPCMINGIIVKEKQSALSSAMVAQLNRPKNATTTPQDSTVPSDHANSMPTTSPASSFAPALVPSVIDIMNPKPFSQPTSIQIPTTVEPIVTIPPSKFIVGASDQTSTDTSRPISTMNGTVLPTSSPITFQPTRTPTRAPVKLAPVQAPIPKTIPTIGRSPTSAPVKVVSLPAATLTPVSKTRKPVLIPTRKPTLSPISSRPTRSPTFAPLKLAPVPAPQSKTRTPILRPVGTVKPTAVPKAKATLRPTRTKTPLESPKTIAPYSGRQFRVRINSGDLKEDWIDPETGIRWLRDLYFVGQESNATYVVPCGNLNTFYCTYRFGTEIMYKIPVPYNGIYNVSLYFIETHWQEPMMRLMDISIQGGSIVVDDFDSFTRAGGRLKPGNITFPTVLVTDGNIDIRITNNKLKQKCILSGISVEELLK